MPELGTPLMAVEWNFTRHIQDACQLQTDYKELYERAREATREAQKEGDAQLKAAIAAATAVRRDPISLSPLSLAFSDSELEKAYLGVLSSTSDKKDVIPFAFEFLVRVMLICFLVQMHPLSKEDSVSSPFSYILARLIPYLWIAGTCFTILVLHFNYSSWYVGNRSTIFLTAYTSLWLGEAAAMLVACPDSSLDLSLVLVQCSVMSVLHRAPFSSHLKTRLLGFGLQLIGVLARGVNLNAVQATLHLTVCHVVGAAVAYLIDQQSRIVFLKSSQYLTVGDVCADSKLCCQGGPRRALGGFAGGFAGVSSLKCRYPPLWTTPSSNFKNLSTEYLTTSIPSTVESCTSQVSSSRHSLCSSFSSNIGGSQFSMDRFPCSNIEQQHDVYWHFMSETRDCF